MSPAIDSESIDPRPLHERIAADLRAQIRSGDYAADTAIPSTEQLKTRFEASNATVQKALGLLKNEGLIVGRPGSSVKVRRQRLQTMTPSQYSPPAAPGDQYRWITEAENRGQTGKSQLLEVAEVIPPADVREALGITADETAVLRKQILLLNDEPCELVKSYYPLELARNTPIAQKRRIRGGTPALLAEAGYPPVRTVDRVSACIATQEQYETLRLPSDLPILRTLRVVHSREDRVIEVTEMAKASHLYELRYDF
ncbi:GntR family transcriptional regulator [Streptomyces sp. NBC_01571]|uniref:GntR family transcriptional regulator n=1 Tax=Streptomyces sp. NBC_01571 TaxID=2975883 RepID=UPI0022586865|nr:GntR family transcriptional regulator [Streptomyces sp. NBC_01571]MCX4581017.1 GntR family transcriptional regulator [Streptomyces sp. NBC_01571]